MPFIDSLIFFKKKIEGRLVSSFILLKKKRKKKQYKEEERKEREVEKEKEKEREREREKGRRKWKIYLSCEIM